MLFFYNLLLFVNLTFLLLCAYIQALGRLSAIFMHHSDMKAKYEI